MSKVMQRSHCQLLVCGQAEGRTPSGTNMNLAVTDEIEETRGKGGGGGAGTIIAVCLSVACKCPHESMFCSQKYVVLISY